MRGTRAQKVVYRKPKESDARQLMLHINRLIDEDTYILANAKHYSLKEERAWLKSVLKRMRTGNSACVVAEAGGRIVGLAHVDRQGDAHATRSRHVGTFGISISDPEFRGKGMGERLARLAIREAGRRGMRLVLLDYLDSNERARRLYRKLGFRECGRIPGAVLFRGRLLARVMMWKAL